MLSLPCALLPVPSSSLSWLSPAWRRSKAASVMARPARSVCSSARMRRSTAVPRWMRTYRVGGTGVRSDARPDELTHSALMLLCLQHLMHRIARAYLLPAPSPDPSPDVSPAWPPHPLQSCRLPRAAARCTQSPCRQWPGQATRTARSGAQGRRCSAAAARLRHRCQGKSVAETAVISPHAVQGMAASFCLPCPCLLSPMGSLLPLPLT